MTTTFETPMRGSRQRAAIVELLSRTEAFRSAQQIHATLNAEGTKVGLATVYRSLTVLAEAGQVDHVRNTDGETLYRRCEQDSHHHHLVCTSCGTTVELSGKAIESWIEAVCAEYGFAKVTHTAELFGLCRKCATRH